jgi:predicted HicB family RNase H-like nuclease
MLRKINMVVRNLEELEKIASIGSNTMQYKNYMAKVEYDDEAGVFHGEVIDLRDVITFEGESVGELRQAFEDSVEDYLEFCSQRGEEPEKPFSGRFLLRISPELHREISMLAKLEDSSLNQWIKERLADAVSYYKHQHTKLS